MEDDVSRSAGDRGPWPAEFPRVPDEEWTSQPLGELALKYDTVETHGWYSNLERTIEQLQSWMTGGELLIDYSGGTGILLARLLPRIGDLKVRLLLVDSSPKFLRLALEKLGGEPRVAFRLIRYLKEERRLQLLDEVFDPDSAGPADGIVSTNAIHLYYDLPETLASWRRVLRPGGRVFVQSGNVRNPAAPAGTWIIDETVHAIADAAMDIVREDDRWAAYRPALDDAQRMAAHAALRSKFFLPVRALDHYVGALAAAGLPLDQVETHAIEARVDEWREFLSAYHEGVLGWVGGSRRVEGEDPPSEAVSDRLELVRLAMERTFGGRDTFPCCWTYLQARAAP